MLPKPLLLGVALLGCATSGWSQGGTVVAWGDNRYGQTNVPPGLSNVVDVRAGEWHNLALKADGTLVAWGVNNAGQKNIPSDLTNVVAIAVGGYHNLAVKADSTVVSWGYDQYGQTNVPPGLSHVVAVAGGWVHSVALKADGTVVAWGRNSEGQANPPAGLNNVVAISSGEYHNLALRSDGTVRAWGWNGFGQATIPPSLSNNVVAIAACGMHSLALKNDGTVVAWGWNEFGQTNVPAGLNNVVAIAGGGEHSLALKSDGTVVGWGNNQAWAYDDPNCQIPGQPCVRKYVGQADPPPGLNNVVGIAGGNFHSVALKNNGTSSPIVRFTFAQNISPAGSGSINVSPASGDGKYNSNTVVTVTAVPEANHVFTGWSGGATGMNNPIQITMNGNKTVTATFAAVAANTFTLTANVDSSAGGSISVSPNGPTYASNSVVTLTAAPNTNHIFTGWNGAASGTNNPIQITMNADKTVTATFAPAETSTFTLTTNVNPSSGGRISVRPPGAGQFYRVEAIPAKGFLFSHWSGSRTSNVPELTFQMQSDTELQANFVPLSPDLFGRRAENYIGLVESAESPASEQSGVWRMKLGPDGAYSGRLTLEGKSYPLTGRLTADRVGSKTIQRARQTPLQVVFQVDTNQNTIAGSVTLSENNAAQLFGYRVPEFPRGQASSHAGKYTMALGIGLTADEKSFGNGVAAFTVAPSGSLRLGGRLADGTPFTQQSFVSEQGQFPVYASLYRNKGAVLGWITLTNQPDSDLDGSLVWIKHAGIPKTFFAAGLTNELAVTGSKYVAPSRTTPLLSLENGVLYLDDGNLISSLTNQIALAGNGLRIAEPNPNKVTLRVTPSTGLFSGRFQHPDAAISSGIYGAILQKQSGGAGFFLGNDETGSLLITGAAPAAQP